MPVNSRPFSRSFWTLCLLLKIIWLAHFLSFLFSEEPGRFRKFAVFFSSWRCLLVGVGAKGASAGLVESLSVVQVEYLSLGHLVVEHALTHSVVFADGGSFAFSSFLLSVAAFGAVWN